MPFINETGNVTIEKINELANFTSFPEMLVKWNHIIFNDIFFFVLLCVLCIILFIAANKYRDQLLNNIMYAAAICSIVGFLLRGITAVYAGERIPLINDHQLWIFPLITAILALIIWAIKER